MSDAKAFLAKEKMYGLVPIMLSLLVLGLISLSNHFPIGGIWFIGWFFVFAYDYNKTWTLYLNLKIPSGMKKE